MLQNLLKCVLVIAVFINGYNLTAQSGVNCENYGTSSQMEGSFWNNIWNFTNMIQQKVTLPSSDWIAGTRFKGLLEYKPAGYNFSDKSVKYPIIIFFHGRSSRGNGSATQLCRLFKDMGGDLATHLSIPGRVERETGLFTQVDGEGNTYKYIVVSPQFTEYERFYPEPAGGNNYPSANAVDSVIKYLLEERFAGKIDERRVYLTGYSNGANMIIEYAGSSVERAKKIAAIMPVALCSQLGHFSNVGINAQNIGNAKLKTWFVYCKDDVCGVDVPLGWVNAIKAVPGAVTPRLTTLTDNGVGNAGLYNCSDTLEHDAWSRAYDPNFKASFTGNGTGQSGSVNDGINTNMYQWFTQSTSAVLPVKLKSFTARLVNGKVELKWITTDEKDNASFTVERAGPDQQFISLVTLEGMNNHTGEKEYSYIDAAPLPDLSYYRLVQTDIDGTKNYFEIKRIMNADDKGPGIIVSPNPFQSELSAYITLKKSQKLVVTLSDMTGKILKTTNGVYGAGSTEIKLNSSTLPKGVYLLKVAGESISFSGKVIKR